MVMGGYGIGVSRLISSIIEQNNDADGIIWPREITPYQVLILPLDVTNSQIMQEAIALHDQLKAQGFQVLLDDRDERPGVMFADMELIGIPHRIVVGERGLKEGKLEYQGRSEQTPAAVAPDALLAFVKARLCAQ